MSVTFDESIINRPTPWAACAAFETFLAQGGQCRLTGETNWPGIVFTCAMNADPADPGCHKPELLVALGWSHLAILIRESLATGVSPEDSVGIITGAMWVRAKMIVRCGNQPGDHICDRDKLVEWCLGLPSVRLILQITTIPHILQVDPDARSVAEVLACLVEEGRLERSGDVARLLDLITLAKEVPPANIPIDLGLRARHGEF